MLRHTYFNSKVVRLKAVKSKPNDNILFGKYPFLNPAIETNDVFFSERLSFIRGLENLKSSLPNNTFL